MTASSVPARLRELERAVGDAAEVGCSLCGDIRCVTRVVHPSAPKPRCGRCTACGRAIPVVCVVDPYAEVL